MSAFQDWIEGRKIPSTVNDVELELRAAFNAGRVYEKQQSIDIMPASIIERRLILRGETPQNHPHPHNWEPAGEKVVARDRTTITHSCRCGQNREITTWPMK